MYLSAATNQFKINYMECLEENGIHNKNKQGIYHKLDRKNCEKKLYEQQNFLISWVILKI